MEYDYTETTNFLSKVLSTTLDTNSIKLISILPTEELELDLSNLAFIIFCLEPTLTLNNKQYQSVIQFYPYRE